jgi:imidazole glycerol-phosphate synthase subunit HisF
MPPHTHRSSPKAVRDAAQAMRDAPTDAEARLWEILRAGRLGPKFRRQHPIGSFIVDFFSHEAALVIEVDGSIHDVPEQRRRDEQRQAALESAGLRVLRFTNDEVLNDLARVIVAIQRTCRERHPFPSPPMSAPPFPGGKR